MGKLNALTKNWNEYLRVFCNFQVNNWAELIPFMEFAHNARTHSATTHSPFQVWYGYQPEFIPPLNFATTIPTVEERLRSMDRIRNEVTAALKLAAETMKRSGPKEPSKLFTEGDLVWLEGTHIDTGRTIEQA